MDRDDARSIELLDSIQSSEAIGPVCFVTFNYDTLIEQSLTHFDISFPTIGDLCERSQMQTVQVARFDRLDLLDSEARYWHDTDRAHL